MNRRHFLASLISFTAVGAVGFRLWPEEGMWNPCLDERMPEALRNHELVLAAWEGLDPSLVWDSHAHLIGTGDNNSGIWLNPTMRSLLHPVQFIQLQFYLNASCPTQGTYVDVGYVDRLVRLHHDFRLGTRLMLLAFDYRYDQQGRVVRANSPFYVPNEYAAAVKKAHSEAFEWIASIHPYRDDGVTALAWVVAHGARAVKWLPGAMGIDPSSPLCDCFYAALRKHNVPLLSHAGDEHAVDVADSQQFNNPLLLRRPLEQGVKVIVAHCALTGKSIDHEGAPNGAAVPNVVLFARLMAEPRYEGLLFGDLSGLTQLNRELETIALLFEHTEWHHRLINGSDYPLPGVMPLFSLQRYVAAGYLDAKQADILSQIRRYNPLLFDFLLKRTLKIHGKKLARGVFESARLFMENQTVL